MEISRYQAFNAKSLRFNFVRNVSTNYVEIIKLGLRTINKSNLCTERMNSAFGTIEIPDLLFMLEPFSGPTNFFPVPAALVTNSLGATNSNI